MKAKSSRDARPAGPKLFGFLAVCAGVVGIVLSGRAWASFPSLAERIPVYLAANPDKTNVAAGIACAAMIAPR